MLILLAVILLASVQSNEAEKCDKDFCSLVDCYPVTRSECKGVFIEKGGLCGCCDACYDAIEPGQPCQRLDLSNPPQALCKDGYWCDGGICRPLLG